MPDETVSTEKVLQQALRLPLDDRAVLAHDIWESIEREAQAVELSDSQKADLLRRLDDYRRNPDDESSWEDVKRRLLAGRGAA